MKNIKKQLLLIMLLLFAATSFCQNRKVELTIENKTYKVLNIRSHQLQGGTVNFLGQSDDGCHWKFTIPDSVVKKTLYFDFRGKVYEYGDNHIGFIYATDGNSLIGREINFNNEDSIIRLNVVFSYTKHEVNNQYISTLNKVVTIQEWDADYFSIDANQNIFLKENMLSPYFSFFYGTKEYDEFLSEYASKIKENPYSIYYMGNMVRTPNYYKSKDDIANLYNLFSKEVQNSYFGKIVYNNFSTFKINNIKLKNCATDNEENIVGNQNKFTLLIFSASWCVPCHKKIPVLKEIYNNMSDFLNMVYITTDDGKSIPQWNKLMRKEKIEWESYSLIGNEIWKQIWNIKAIPDYILIDTNFIAKKISLNDKKDIDELYSMIKNK